MEPRQAEPVLNSKLERTGYLPIPGYVLVQHDVIVTKLMSLILVVFTQLYVNKDSPYLPLAHAQVALTCEWQ